MEAILRVSSAGWGRRRIAMELGCSPETVRQPLRQGGWQPYGKPCRRSVLDGHLGWIKERFLAHRGNADVVRQELEREQGIRTSLRTAQRVHDAATGFEVVASLGLDGPSVAMLKTLHAPAWLQDLVERSSPIRRPA